MRSCGLSLAACLGLLAGCALAASNCSTQDNCAGCVASGCGWCTWCPYCEGRCLGQGDGAFTCSEIYSNIPSAQCGDTPRPKVPGGGYDCSSDGKCVPVPPFAAPSFGSLSACLNGCQPPDAKPPFWRCNPTAARCEKADGHEGTTKEQCEELCQDHKLCSGGLCESQGVDGPGGECPAAGCPKPAPGPDCAGLSAGGCRACLAEADRCGWCPQSQKCLDFAPHAAIFSCPPGFTSNSSACPADEAEEPGLILA